MNKRGQVAIYVIIAIVIIAGVLSFIALRDGVGVQVPAALEPVYVNFLNCLEEDVRTGISVLESQGGYIELPDFEPGSNYMPFSSQLNFLGNPIPYWYYVSGNNIQREQVPSISNMEDSLEDFIEGEIRNCVYDVYYDQGFEIVQDEPQAQISINEDNVLIDLDMSFSISRANDSAVVANHELEVESQLGKLYDSALKIYEQEQETLFLENYAVDTLRLYAPVDGVELTCAPLLWNADEVFDELGEAIERNTLALRNQEGDFTLTEDKNKYFVLDLGVDDNVRFINSKNWPSTFEVIPSQGPVMRSNPVGNQPGLGVIGFCYVNYHFVYNVRYPVLAQVYSDDASEIFQFPMAVVIEGNRPREAFEVSGEVDPPREFCVDKNSLVQVNVFDTNLNSVDADISYSCFGQVCDVGSTSNGVLESGFPECVNGFVLAETEGFLESKTLFSSVEPGSVDIILDRVYEQQIELKVDGQDYNGEAIISFISDKVSQTIIYPEQRNVDLVEGQYEIRVDIYRNSSISLEGRVQEHCYETPRSGLGGLFGLTEEECVSIDVPEQVISNALSGGGVQQHFILESDLINSDIVEIGADSLPNPETLEDLQSNYILFEEQNLDVVLR